MCTDARLSNALPARSQRGVTLVELILFIVIVGVAVAGILSVMNITAGRSADPMVRKQALAIAESLMEEITLQPFTYCDPDDPAASTAASAAACATPQGLGPTGGTETRYAGFDNVGDYHGFSMNGISDLNNVGIGGLAGYNATVAVVQDARGGIAAADSLRIDVVVTGPGNERVALTGYRFRYAPRAVP